MGVSKNRGTPKWMVYNGKLKWMIRGYHYFWKHPYRLKSSQFGRWHFPLKKHSPSTRFAQLTPFEPDVLGDSLRRSEGGWRGEVVNVPTIEKRRIRSFVPPKKKDIYMKIDEYRPCGYICGVFFFFDIFFVGGGCFLWGAMSSNVSLSGYICTLFWGYDHVLLDVCDKKCHWIRLAGGFEYLWDSRLREDALKLGRRYSSFFVDQLFKRLFILILIRSIHLNFPYHMHVTMVPY